MKELKDIIKEAVKKGEITSVNTLEEIYQVCKRNGYKKEENEFEMEMEKAVEEKLNKINSLDDKNLEKVSGGVQMSVKRKIAAWICTLASINGMISPSAFAKSKPDITLSAQTINTKPSKGLLGWIKSHPWISAGIIAGIAIPPTLLLTIPAGIIGKRIYNRSHTTNPKASSEESSKENVLSMSSNLKDKQQVQSTPKQTSVKIENVPSSTFTDFHSQDSLIRDETRKQNTTEDSCEEIKGNTIHTITSTIYDFLDKAATSLDYEFYNKAVNQLDSLTESKIKEINNISLSTPDDVKSKTEIIVNDTKNKAQQIFDKFTEESKRKTEENKRKEDKTVEESNCEQEKVKAITTIYSTIYAFQNKAFDSLSGEFYNKASSQLDDLEKTKIKKIKDISSSTLTQVKSKIKTIVDELESEAQQIFNSVSEEYNCFKAKKDATNTITSAIDDLINQSLDSFETKFYYNSRDQLNRLKEEKIKGIEGISSSTLTEVESKIKTIVDELGSEAQQIFNSVSENYNCFRAKKDATVSIQNRIDAITRNMLDKQLSDQGILEKLNDLKRKAGNQIDSIETTSMTYVSNEIERIFAKILGEASQIEKDFNIQKEKEPTKKSIREVIEGLKSCSKQLDDNDTTAEAERMGREALEQIDNLSSDLPLEQIKGECEKILKETLTKVNEKLTLLTEKQKQIKSENDKAAEQRLQVFNDQLQLSSRKISINCLQAMVYDVLRHLEKLNTIADANNFQDFINGNKETISKYIKAISDSYKALSEDSKKSIDNEETIELSLFMNNNPTLAQITKNLYHFNKILDKLNGTGIEKFSELVQNSSFEEVLEFIEMIEILKAPIRQRNNLLKVLSINMQDRIDKGENKRYKPEAVRFAFQVMGRYCPRL